MTKTQDKPSLVAGTKDGQDNNQDIRQRVLLACLNLAAQEDWGRLSVRDIVRHADISSAEFYVHFEDKEDILLFYGKQIDQHVLQTITETESHDLEGSVRDRLFDVLMERLDKVNEHREAVLSILQSFCFDPKQALIGLPHLAKSMSKMLEVSGISTSGLFGAVKVAGLTAIYCATLRTWKEDDSQDLTKTMAVLDRNLSRAEKAADFLGPRGL